MTTTRVLLWLSFAVAVAVAAGCGKKDELACDAVVAGYIKNVETVVEREVQDERERKLITTGLPGLRERMLASCRELPWSESARRCIAEARTANELEKCNPFADQEPAP